MKIKNSNLLNTLKLRFESLLTKYGWSGDYPNWQEASSKCDNYDAPVILEKVKAATLKVKSGEAVYERDSVLFPEIEYSWPLLTGLMWIGAETNGRLHVTDFGGALGSSYFQNRFFLNALRDVRWNIVEQPSFVTCGNQFIADQSLQFFNTIEDSIAKEGAQDVLLLSCVLPYLKDPIEALSGFMKFRFPYIIIDNTYFNYESRDRICIQRVPPEIYQASYPCWFLDYEKIRKILEKEYTIVAEYTNDSRIRLDGRKIQYQGWIIKRNQ